MPSLTTQCLGYVKRCHWFKHCQELLTLGTHLKFMVVTIHTKEWWWVGEGGTPGRVGDGGIGLGGGWEKKKGLV